MENVKYILIVSQHYYSRHCFVVSAAEENFREKALTLIEKLEDYKRSDDDQREYKYGSERETAYLDVSKRWNVNDTGDIYFMPCRSISDAMDLAREHDSIVWFDRQFKGAPKKRLEKIESDIFKHHSIRKIKDIVGSVFEIL